MVPSHEIGEKYCDLRLLFWCGNGEDGASWFGGCHIRKLLVAHLHSFFQYFIPGGVGEDAGVVDRF